VNAVRLRIDEIVLDGVDVPDVGAFRTSLVAELSRLASGHQGTYPSGAAPVLVGTPVGPSTVDGLGAEVARSVWSSMVPGGSP
jgi:hypothetical protein